MTKRTFGRFRSSFLGDEHGVGAVEFALVLPVLILIYLGGVELSHAITADRKLTAAGSAVGDLVAQGGSSISSAEIDDIFVAAQAIMQPYGTSRLKIVVSNVRIDRNGDEVESSCGFHDAKRATGSAITVPSGVRIEGSWLIVTEVHYEYVPTLGQIFSDSINLSDTFYMRPRQVDSIELPC